MKEYLQRFRNPGVILSIVSIVGLILFQFGIDIDLAWLDATAKLICCLGVTIGILNNPTSGGIDLPFLKKELNK